MNAALWRPMGTGDSWWTNGQMGWAANGTCRTALVDLCTQILAEGSFDMFGASLLRFFRLIRSSFAQRGWIWQLSKQTETYFCFDQMRLFSVNGGHWRHYWSVSQWRTGRVIFCFWPKPFWEPGLAKNFGGVVQIERQCWKHKVTGSLHFPSFSYLIRHATNIHCVFIISYVARMFHNSLAIQKRWRFFSLQGLECWKDCWIKREKVSQTQTCLDVNCTSAYFVCCVRQTVRSCSGSIASSINMRYSPYVFYRHHMWASMYRHTHYLTWGIASIKVFLNVFF